MGKYEVVEHWPNADIWQVGDIIDLSSPEKLLEEGKVKVYKAPAKKKKAEKKVVSAEVEGAPVKKAKK